MSSETADRSNVRREESPAETEGIQDEYRRDLARRIRKLRGVLRETIVENDALGIKGGYETRLNDEDDISSREEFDFEQAPPKQVEFRKQLREWIDEGILEPTDIEEIEEGRHYTAIYIDSAYAQGMAFANGLLIQKDVDVPDEDFQTVVSRPIHASTLETLYSRNYEGLEDITEDMDRSISRILTEGFRKGWGTRKLADEITKEVRDIQHTRARALARTEVMNAHNEGTLNRYDSFGVEQVEILTHTPCPICQRIEDGDPYTVSEATGLIPAHPNCVCTWAPIV
jgi:SPP1 gp7 family putative phage head morphogenesis protein